MAALHFGGQKPPQRDDPPDLSREQVLALFRDRDNDALKRHTGLVGTDGAGTIYVLCGCELRFGYEEWGIHLRGVINTIRRYKPSPKQY